MAPKTIESILAAAIALSYIRLLTGCGEKESTCETVREFDVADSEATPGGMSAKDVLSAIQSPSVYEFTWRAADTNVDSETTQVTVSVGRTNDSARFVETEQTGNRDSSLGCGPKLLIPVQVSLVTSDGALDDDFSDRLVFDTRRPVAVGSSQFDVAFDFEDLEGWLRPTTDDSEGEFSASFGADQRGLIGSARVVETANGVAEEFEIVGHWGELPPASGP